MQETLLIKDLNIQEFIDFTLWSQHLILHTRESLNAFLIASGYKIYQYMVRKDIQLQTILNGQKMVCREVITANWVKLRRQN